MIEFPDHEWAKLGNCLGCDPDLFFPERGASTREAKAVCGACVVKDECLEFALRTNEKFGIWGGTSERERRRMRRARNLASPRKAIVNRAGRSGTQKKEETP